MDRTRDKTITRRDMLVVIGAGVTTGLAVTACKGESAAPKKAPPAAAKKEPAKAPPAKAEAPKEATCEATDLDAQSKTLRQQLQYVAKSPHADKNCANCAQWVADTYPAPCGGCKLFKGSVDPKGYCLSHAPMQPS